ncbi:MAG: hypothetical protein RIR86_772 [Acidobacteriota bacterium]
MRNGRYERNERNGKQKSRELNEPALSAMKPGCAAKQERSGGAAAILPSPGQR